VTWPKALVQIVTYLTLAILIGFCVHECVDYEHAALECETAAP
jgi:hypothetical protein